MIVAIAERRNQGVMFADLNESVKKETRREWQKKVDDWEADHSKPNPYVIDGGKSGTCVAL